MEPPNIFDYFPAEIIQYTLTLCHPLDIAHFAETCRRARLIVYILGDQYLWRQLLLGHPFDDPHNSLQAQSNSGYMRDFDWRAEFQTRIKAEAILLAGERRAFERTDALQTLLRVVQTALPSTQGLASTPSANLTWVERIVKESRLLETEPFRSEINLRAKLRSYLAFSLDSNRDDQGAARLKTRRLRSRCFLYDLRNYRADNHWGPYKSDGSVNWVHVEIIITVISMNILELPSMLVWAETKPPAGLEATRAYSTPGSQNRKPEDWAVVEGTWRRYICFMDYRDLFAYNHASIERTASFFDDDLFFQEATRLIELSLSLISADQASPHIRNLRAPGYTLDERYSPLFFSGKQRGANGNEATVDGCVRMGEDGVAKWQFVTVYGGLSQWSSEGIQLGSVGSAAGIVGIWTGARHEHGDPVGPYWLWKVDDGNAAPFRDN